MALADHDYASPFEGPEKLLEIWFAPSAAHVPDATSAEGGKSGLRAVSKDIWEEMLNIVKCKVLSSVEGIEMDAYLLRWVFAFLVRRLSTSFDRQWVLKPSAANIYDISCTWR